MLMIIKVLQSFLSFLFFCFYISSCWSQIKIGDSPSIIDDASLLELESTNKVLVITKATSEEMMMITPLTGGMIYNTDENCIFYFNGLNWISMCNSSNLDEFNETVTSLVENTDGTFTFTNEEGTETILPNNESSLVDSGNGSFTYTKTGENPIIFNGAPETTSTLVENLNGSYTYTNEEGGETIINLSNSNNEVLGETGSIFFAGSDGAPTENNNNLFWDNIDHNLGVNTSVPNSTLSVGGSIATQVSFVSGRDLGANETNHTILIDGSGSSRLFLPLANEVVGRMYIIKKKPNVELTIVASYLDSDSVTRQLVPVGVNVLWLQSNGFIWEQIN